MPKVAEPPKVELPPNQVQVAGKQEDFRDAGFALAAALGFEGEPHLQSEAGFRVDDAQNYCVKILHEHFQAAAKGEPQPDYTAACMHLGVDNPTEQAAIDAATKVAYDAGKGTKLETVDKTTVVVGANLTLDTSKLMAGKAG